MSIHTRADRDARDRAALYALGGMEESEAHVFAEHLATCELCRDEVARLGPAVEELLLLAPEAEPPESLRARVLAHVSAPYTLRPESERSWLAADVPGVELCPLWLDSESERHTILVRMSGGASLPTHQHGGCEECYVVKGDLHDGDLSLGPGDYIRFDKGSRHSVSSRDGCLLLVTSSLHDRRIDAPG